MQNYMIQQPELFEGRTYEENVAFRQLPINEQAEQVRFDYDNQAWIKNGVYVKCGHPSECGCYGKAHEGERAS